MRRLNWGWSQFFTIIIILVILLFSFKAVQEILNRRAINQELKGLDKQILDLQVKQQNLESLITYLQSSEFIEKEARTRLNLRKEGERIIIIPVESSTQPQLIENQVTTTTPENLSNIQKWWYYVFPR
jgi:cell division protein FtsB